MKKHVNNKKGFTVVETLIAIVILVFTVTGTFAAIQNALSNSIYSKIQVQAFFLAQEAVEYIRVTRDSNVLAGQNWLANFAGATQPCQVGVTCVLDATVDPSSTNPPAYNACAGNCPNLKQDPISKLYGHSNSWTDTSFKREITINQINANEITVTVAITWSKGLLSKTFTIKESVFNWK